MKRSTVKPSGVSAASSTSNTAPVAGVTLGAAISAFARSSGSMPWVMPLPLPLRAASSRGFASRRLCAKQRRNKESDCHAQARPRYDSARSEEHTSELQSLMRSSYAVFCLKKKKQKKQHIEQHTINKQKTNDIK